ncbi:MAG: zinc transporter ZupT [Holophagaceae bacterium]|uniref:Zinc transporter ZupT n=1 Tax=Candidatus Geothrix skivensis TaxID=2954439 RepID=A0A9D7SK68_9BACT|nr:zinc transporter ZupT [Candidatus Geothrix skivensis]
MSDLTLAFGLTLFAGLSTGIGSAIAFFARHTNTRFLSVSLGFSAGVMLYVSFIEILPKAQASLSVLYGPRGGAWATTLAFFAGIALIALIDQLVPRAENPHEAHRIEELHEDPAGRTALARTGLFMALAIAIHNFPEGLATFMATMQEPRLGLPIAAAIAIHNIPEGIAVSVPIYYATGSRRKALGYSFLSGLAEPAGAVLGYFLLHSLVSEALFGLVFAAVAGIMVFISLDELLPTAEKYGKHHHCIGGLVAGMAVMALSLLLLI